MKKKCTAVLVSCVVSGVLMGVEATAGVTTDRVPALTFPEKCSGDVDGSVPLLTFFFSDSGKNNREPDTAVSMFPCGSVQDDKSGLPGIVFPQNEDTESERTPQGQG